MHCVYMFFTEVSGRYFAFLIVFFIVDILEFFVYFGNKSLLERCFANVLNQPVAYFFTFKFD